MADRTYQLEIELDNGTKLNAGEFVAPQGPQGVKGDTGKTPSITANATVGATVGTPSVEVVQSGTTDAPILSFNFSNLKGATGSAGAPGKDGVTPTISATATVGATVGTPSVEVVKSGSNASPSFAFNFTNLKGATGAKGDKGAPGDPGPQGVGISKVTIKEVV